MTGRLQQFYNHWRDISANSEFNKTFPYELPLGTKPPVRPDSTSGNKIIVTKSYDDMFHRILSFRGNDQGPEKGVVLTGQPGTGALYDQIPTPCELTRSVLQEKPPS